MRSSGLLPRIYLQQRNHMIHRFPKDIRISVPECFNNPFRYHPHPLVKEAADLLTRHIEADKSLPEELSEGKMLGVLVIKSKEDELGFLAAFSGNVGGRSHIEGFVPPIFDLLDPDGHFKIREAEITEVNHRISSLENSERLAVLRSELIDSERSRDEEIQRHKAHMAITKRERDEIRSEISDPSGLETLLQESRFEKAELKRIKIRWEKKIEVLRKDISAFTDEIHDLKALRAEMSDKLQHWIFEQYIVHNHSGEASSISDIFEREGLIPPGGTGECAAPKLLEYAYLHGLEPVAMGEFWYGQSPETAVRTHGHFYPSCTSKCGPLLRFMLKGTDLEKESPCTEELPVIYEDEALIVIDKPSGIPSVPGLDGRISAFEILNRVHRNLHVVHRLDMDTSGAIIFAKTSEAAVGLQRQFEDHTVEKTYLARLSSAPEGMELKAGDRGEISLPLSPDYDERPRQKVDISQGKPSVTLYKVLSVNEDSTTDVAFHPLTGRTHQLRIHSAHLKGLGHPIVGDMLYGGSEATRLHLHAYSLSFNHPVSGKRITLTTPEKI